MAGKMGMKWQGYSTPSPRSICALHIVVLPRCDVLKENAPHFAWVFPRICAILSGIVALVATAVYSAEKPLTIETARVAITGADVNAPEFEGWGGPKHGIGWPGALLKTRKGELLFFHSAGY